MKYPPDQFNAALRATRCPEALIGPAMRINTFGEEDIARELLMMAWQRALEVAGRDVETFFPLHSEHMLGNIPPILSQSGDYTRVTVPDELLLDRATEHGSTLGLPELTPSQARVLRGYARAVERAYQDIARREQPALAAWQKADDFLTGR